MLGREGDTDGGHHGGERGAPGAPPESAFEPEELVDLGLEGDDLGAPGELTPEALWRLDERVSERLPCEHLAWSASQETRSLAYYELRRRLRSAELVERLNEVLEQAGFTRPAYRREVPLTLQWLVEAHQGSFDRWVAAAPAHAELVERLAAWFDEPSEVLFHTLLHGTTTAEMVATLLGRLSDRERRIIEQRFGLGENERAVTKAQLGDSFGVSRHRIQQIQRVALAKMRHSAVTRYALDIVRREVLANEALVGESLELDRALHVILEHLSPAARLLATVKGLRTEDLRSGFGAIVGDSLFVGVPPSEALEVAVAALSESGPSSSPWLLEGSKLTQRSAKPKIAEGEPLPVKLRVMDGFVLEAQANAQSLRAAKLHRLARTWTPPMPYETFFEPSMVEELGTADSADPGRIGLSTIDHAPHLFTRLGDLGWMPVFAPGDEPRAAASPAPLPTASMLPEHAEGTILAQIEEVLERGGVVSLASLRSEMWKSAGPKRTAGSIQGIAGSRPDRIVRVAPGLYARRGQDLVPHLERALEEAQVEHFVHGRLAGDPRGTFALWRPEMEQLWCEWGERELPGPLYRALLAVVDPSTWPTDADTRRRWNESKARLGSTDELVIRAPAPNTKIPPAERVFATLLDLRAQGRTNWLRVNRIIGSRLSTTGSWTTLALLARVGAFDAPPAWHLEHVARRDCRWLHGDAWSELARFRLYHPTLTWDDLPMRHLLYEARISEFERPGRKRPAGAHQPWYTEHNDILDERIDEILRSDLELPPEDDDGDVDADSASPEE